jgi:hypothetical protein
MHLWRNPRWCTRSAGRFGRLLTAAASDAVPPTSSSHLLAEANHAFQHAPHHEAGWEIHLATQRQ